MAPCSTSKRLGKLKICRLNDSWTRKPGGDGSYETGPLWRDGSVKLPNIYGVALRRLETTERGLKKAPEKAAAYQKTMQEYQRCRFFKLIVPT